MAAAAVAVVVVAAAVAAAVEEEAAEEDKISAILVYSFGISETLISLKQTYLPSLFTKRLM